MALAVSGMLSVKMEDYEVALGSLYVVAVGTIGVDELHVILVSARVVMIEEIRTDSGSVEESHRGVKLLVHLHASILIAVEHHVISAATEQEGEERGVAPAAAVADSHGREKLLEVLRGAVVRRHHIVEQKEAALLTESLQPRIGVVLAVVEIAHVPVERFAYNQHEVSLALAAPHLLLISLQRPCAMRKLVAEARVC